MLLPLASIEFASTARADEPVYACGASDAGGANNLFTGYETFGIVAASGCANPGIGYLDLKQDGVNRVAFDAASGWVATVPSGLVIRSANVPNIFADHTVGTGYVASFYWDGGGQRVVDTNQSFSVAGLSSSKFGWELKCAPSQGGSCAPDSYAWLRVYDVQLDLVESTPPAIVAIDSNNLFYEAGKWVRGSFPIAFAATSVAGVCSVAAVIDGQTITDPSAPPVAPDRVVWQQCPNRTFSQSINTNVYANGPMNVTYVATDAAAETSTPSRTVNVDNAPVDVALSGPISASSAAGVQTITATATAGPSGVQGISCSLDGARAVWYPSASAQVAVQGVGVHHVSCYALNHAINSSGNYGASPTASWTLTIGQPTVSTIAFSRIRAHCMRVVERVRTRAHWVTIRRHGHHVKIKRRGQMKKKMVLRCRTTGTAQKTWRARFGKGARVSGALEASNGVALGGQTVQVLTAADNGRNAFARVATVTTAANGTWSASLPPGPSRLVEAVYGGATTLEPATSNTVKLIVPAKVRIRITPRHARWGATIRITGRVLGGYIPAGKLLRLRIGVAGVKGTVGIPGVAADGRFRTTYTFAPGSGVVRYWFSVSTLNEADYPFAPGSSRRVYVTVGPG